MLVEVRGIASRPVRRRGMKPLVEATVVDATGVMKATFFNQPWLERAYRPGTRLMLQGKFQARNRFRVNRHAPTEEVAAVGDAVAEYPATKGITSTQIMALVAEHRGAAFDAVELLPGRLRAAEGLPDVAASYLAAHFGDHEAGRRRLAFEELLLDQLVQLRMRAERRSELAAPALARGADALARVAGRAAAVRPDGRPADRDGRGRRRPRRRAPDAAPADGRGGLGQDGRRAARDAARRRARAPGGADGADRDARRAALRDDPGADARGGGAARRC